MNQDTQDFLEDLKARDDVLSVILFGSWARGNNRVDSDVDLLVIVTEGYRRAVEYKNKQAFEIIYITENGAQEYWKGHKDDCFGLWSIAKILYEKDGIAQNLKTAANKIIQEGKKAIDPYQIAQFKFSAEDGIFAIESMQEKDPATANLVLQKVVLHLTELFFDLRHLWTPAPKQRLFEIKEIKPSLYNSLIEFYAGDKVFQEKIEIAKEIVALVFEIQ